DFGRGKQRMSAEGLEKLVKDYMGRGFSVSGFAWQGGEPTLMGVVFFRKAVELQKKYGSAGQQVSNTLQTNGILLDDEWCRFFRDNKFLLGISVDGPKEFHDLYRIDHSGKGTFDRVIRGIETCRKYDVQFSALILLNNNNVQQPDALFEFCLENELTYLQFIPCVETDPATGGPAEFSITSQQYGDFLCRLFDLWYEYGPEKLNIREFDSLVTHYVMGKHTICAYSKQCAGFVVIEHTGDAFCCEFFVEPQWRLGNILETPIEKLAGDSKKKTFARNKQQLPNKCLVCQHLDICRGGCMKDRNRWNDEGGQRESYFCESYKQFFDYTVPRFMQIAAGIKNGSLSRHTRSADKIRLYIEKQQ
ncbi:MAG: anaerobic sulfatase maturase, partial [Planctomycetota bacterium]